MEVAFLSVYNSLACSGLHSRKVTGLGGGRWIGKDSWRSGDTTMGASWAESGSRSYGWMRASSKNVWSYKGNTDRALGDHDLRVSRATLKGDKEESGRKIEGKPGESEATDPKEEKV